MFFDLNVPLPHIGLLPGQVPSKKGKGKQPQQPQTVVYTSAQVAAIEARIDILVHLGYTVIAFSQIVQKKIDAKTHVNVIDGLLGKLRKRTGLIFLKRLTVVLDEDSEKGFGLTNANASLLSPYDLIALTPTTAASFSLACLTHSLPSPLTAHVISVPLTLPRLPFHMKHTLVRTAIKNGAVFEINYAGALGYDDPAVIEAGGGESGAGARRNWWAAAREVVRVIKGKGIIVSGGVPIDSSLRAPRDVANLITLLGVAQDIAHSSSTKSPKSLVLRAQTRRTYRAVLSEPRLVIPENYTSASLPLSSIGDSLGLQQDEVTDVPGMIEHGTQASSNLHTAPRQLPSTETSISPQGSKKRLRDGGETGEGGARATNGAVDSVTVNVGTAEKEKGSVPKKRKRESGKGKKPDGL